jgi:hypothetical protein
VPPPVGTPTVCEKNTKSRQKKKIMTKSRQVKPKVGNYTKIKKLKKCSTKSRQKESYITKSRQPFFFLPKVGMTAKNNPQ